MACSGHLKADGDLRDWYAAANGDAGGPLNYRDPIYWSCLGEAELSACLDDNWTGSGAQKRIDALFAQDHDGCRARTSRAHTITFAEGDAADLLLTGSDNPLNYSDHRAVRAEIYYPD